MHNVLCGRPNAASIWKYAFPPLSLLALLGFAACGDDGVSPEDLAQPSVEIDGERFSLYALGETRSLSASLRDGATGPLVWTSTDRDVVSVSEAGIVTAVGNGSAQIEVEEAGGVQDAVTVTVDAASWTSASVGENFVCALAPDGSAFCWGDNYWGQVGSGSEESSISVPTPVAGDLTFATLSSGEDHTCAVTGNGAAYCWGQNRYGELGVGDDRAMSDVPVSVASDRTFTRVSAGAVSLCGLDSDGGAWCWGDNRYGQLGDGTLEERRTPVPVEGDLRFEEIAVGTFHTCALEKEGAAYCWGLGTVGSLGTGDTGSTTRPAPVQGDRSYATVTAGDLHSCAVETGGDTYCWGINDGRELGLDTGDCNPEFPVACSIAPVRVPLVSSVSAVSAGGFSPGYTCAVTGNGTYCWGADMEGVVAIGDSTMSFTRVFAGIGRACAIDDDEFLYCWSEGELGEVSGPRPIRVGDRRTAK